MFAADRERRYLYYISWGRDVSTLGTGYKRHFGLQFSITRLGIFLISVEKEPEMETMQNAIPQRPKATDPAEVLELIVDLLGQAL